MSAPFRGTCTVLPLRHNPPYIFPRTNVKAVVSPIKLDFQIRTKQLFAPPSAEWMNNRAVARKDLTRMGTWGARGERFLLAPGLQINTSVTQTETTSVKDLRVFVSVSCRASQSASNFTENSSNYWIIRRSYSLGFFHPMLWRQKLDHKLIVYTQQHSWCCVYLWIYNVSLRGFTVSPKASEKKNPAYHSITDSPSKQQNWRLNPTRLSHIKTDHIRNNTQQDRVLYITR